MQTSRAINILDQTPPYAIFFTLAALDAAFGVGVWLPTLAAAPFSPGRELAAWHGREMLFGYLGASLCGFFFTALPRWTGRPVQPWAVRVVLTLWLVARIAPPSPHFALAAALPSVALAAIVTFHILAARNTRNFKMAALLWVYAASAYFTADPLAPVTRDFAFRLAIVALAGLVMTIGGRVLPALTTRFDMVCGEASELATKSRIEPSCAAFAALGLMFWLVRPESDASAIALFCAAFGQILRMQGWLGKRTVSSPHLWAFYVAYAMIPAGFALLGAHALAPGNIPQSAGLHVLAVGGFGGMCLAVKSSMIRKRRNLAFVVSGASVAMALLWLAALLCRTAAAFADAPTPWLLAAALTWAAAFALFLYDFRAPLLLEGLLRPLRGRVP